MKPGSRGYNTTWSCIGEHVLAKIGYCIFL